MKQSELLRKQADMMDMAEKHGIDDWRKLVKVEMHGSGRITTLDKTDCFAELPRWNYKSFALGVVEGKPVFEGDELYSICGGRKVTVLSTWIEMDATLWTWNPPKPKTVMIELPINMATYYAELQNQDISVMREACRKALESIKQS